MRKERKSVVNYITAEDIQKGMHHANEVAIIKCRYCKQEQLIGNHMGWIKDHIRDPDNYRLHRCPVCNAETRLRRVELSEIKKILGLKE